MPSTEDKLQTGTPETFPQFYLVFRSSFFFPHRDPERLKVTVFFQLQDLVHILTCFSSFKKRSFHRYVEQGWLVLRTTTSSDPSTAETHFQRHSFQHGFHLPRRRRKSCLYLKILSTVSITSTNHPERISLQVEAWTHTSKISSENVSCFSQETLKTGQLHMLICSRV